MRRWPLAVAVLLLLTGCGPSYRADALAHDVGRTFTHLYVRSVAQEGRVGVTADDLPVQTRCERGGPDTPDEGPGDDWCCLVVVTDPAIGRRDVVYEVVLRPDGCFTADGPPDVVGDARVRGSDGVLRLNPLYAFDGCL